MNVSVPRPYLPLSRFQQLRTRDPDQAREVVGDVFCPHRLTSLDGARRFDTRFHAAAAGRVSLCYLDYGGRVHIAPEAQGTFYLLLIPLAGRAELADGPLRAAYGPGAAGVPPVDRGYTIRVGAGSPHLVVRIVREHLERHLRGMLGRRVAEPVRFDLGMDMAAPALRSWRRVLDLLLDEIDDGGRIPLHPLAMRDMERLLLTRLLLGQPHNHSALLHEPPRDAPPRAIRMAAELIEAHAGEELTVEDIAEAVGVGIRALQAGFRRHLDSTPTRFLRETRLRRVRQELTAADPATTKVTDVAARWGFVHPGHFSVSYRRRYGEPPSATLRR